MAQHDGKSDDMVSSSTNDVNHLIFSSDDLRLKILGEIFGNKTSRNIITLLIENEMTAMQISDKLDQKLNLVLYHLEKMLDLKIISITKKTKNNRGHQVKHYRAKQAVMIFSKNNKIRAQKSKMLSDAIKRVTRFSAISIAGVLTWFVTSVSIQGGKIAGSLDSALKYPRPTLPPYMNLIEPQSANDMFLPIMLGSAVVVSLLIIHRVIISRIHLHQKPIA